MCAYIEYVNFLFSKIYFINVKQFKGIPVSSGRVKRFVFENLYFLITNVLSVSKLIFVVP